MQADKINENLQYLEDLEDQITKLKESIKEGADKEKIQNQISILEERKQTLKENISKQKNKLDESE
ncbi:MAG: hypothetical protein R3250_17895 [Melioribacteraceae bacterium]|nr:hypothetical protein [Melioribacteraceae bacterium]